MRLFNAAVHKDRTAAAKVDRFGGEESSCGKIFNRHTERAGKVIQKTAAARRTCLVQLNGADTVILHADTFHILPADVEQKFNAGKKKIGGAVVRDGFYFSRVDAESRLEEPFTVAGG